MRDYSNETNRTDDIDRRLDRDLEREGGYRGRRRIPLNARGTVRTMFEQRERGADMSYDEREFDGDPDFAHLDNLWRPSDRSAK